MPAIRKACGFVGHRATLGCSKCLCEFTHLRGGGMKWSGEFGNWPLRTIEEHQKNVKSFFNVKILASKQNLHLNMDYVLQYC